MPQVESQKEQFIIYDDKHPKISALVDTVVNKLQVFNLPSFAYSTKSLKISDTDSEMWDNLQVGKTKVLFFVGIETEYFHTKVKNIIKPERNNMLVLLTYTPERIKYVENTLKGIKKAAKREKTANVVERMKLIEERLVTVDDLSKPVKWWPKLLSFLYGESQTDSTNGHKQRSRKEIGVTYVFNEENEKQMSWFLEQRSFLEEHFMIKCTMMNDASMEKYARNSQCIVMYLYSDDLVKRKGQLSDMQKNVLQYAERHRCKLTVFVNKINTKGHSRLMKSTGHTIKLLGEGEMEYWLKLLCDLGLVKVKAKEDRTFYSDVTDKIYPTHFKPKQGAMSRPMTTRDGYNSSRITDMEEIMTVPVHGDSLRKTFSQMLHDACYDYDCPNESLDDTPSVSPSVDVTCSCSFLRFIRRRNN